MSSPGKPPTGWGDLPIEIKINILRNTRDLGSLGALLHASPTLYRACSHDVRSYAETVLTAGPVCGHTAVLFRLCALIRTGRLPVHSTERFYHLVTGEAMCYILRIHESPWGIAPRRLDDDVPPEVVRSLLVTSRQIGNLAADCLRFYLARFQTLRPEHPLPSEPHVNDLYDYSTGGPKCQRVQVKDLNSFQWEEEQRAVRALWRYQVIYELKRAVLVTKSLSWEDPEKLEDMPAVEVPTGPENPYRNSWEDDEIYHMADWGKFEAMSAVRGVPTNCGSPRRSFYGWRYNYMNYIWDVRYEMPYQEDARFDDIIYSPEYEEMNSVAEFISDQHGVDPGASFRNGSLCIGGLRHTSAGPIPLLHPARKDWIKLVEPATAVRFYFCHGPSDGVLPFYHTEFGHFARFGFAFWSAARLRGYGLLGEGYPQPWSWWYHACAPKVANSPNGCIAVSMMLHLTPQSNDYFQNLWLSFADHDIDDADRAMATVVATRGMLVESAKGSTWLYGISSTHSMLCRYNFQNATNAFVGRGDVQRVQHALRYLVGCAVDAVTSLSISDVGLCPCLDAYDQSLSIDAQKCQQRFFNDLGTSGRLYLITTVRASRG